MDLAFGIWLFEFTKYANNNFDDINMKDWDSGSATNLHFDPDLGKNNDSLNCLTFDNKYL